jgi:hypothetical protein
LSQLIQKKKQFVIGFRKKKQSVIRLSTPNWKSGLPSYFTLGIIAYAETHGKLNEKTEQLYISEYVYTAAETQGGWKECG